jgi:hypothetical protein
MAARTRQIDQLEAQPMETNPNPYFPLLASDQADVMRIFLDLMCENKHAEPVHEAKTASVPWEPRWDFNESGFLGESIDLG